MKKVHTSVRLKEIMQEQGLRQADILRMAKPYAERYGERLGKNDLSQYVSGKTEPGQRKLFILGKALNVNPAWLMGMDVPKEFSETTKKNDAIADIILRLRSDDNFMEVVKDLYNSTDEQINAIKSLLVTFKQ